MLSRFLKTTILAVAVFWPLGNAESAELKSPETDKATPASPQKAERLEADRIMTRFFASAVRYNLADQSVYGEIESLLDVSRLAAGVESARVGSLLGQAGGIAQAIQSGLVPPAAIPGLVGQIGALRAQAAQVPRYRSSPNQILVSASSAPYLTDLNGRPLWLHIAYRGYGVHDSSALAHFDARDHHGEIGVFYSPTDDWLLGANAVIQHQSLESTLLQARNDADLPGFRLEAAKIFNDNISFSAAYDFLVYDGKTKVVLPTPNGPALDAIPSAQNRSFITARLNAHFGKQDIPVLPSFVSFDLFSDFYYYYGDFTGKRDSFGTIQRTFFGTSNEQVSLLRTGGLAKIAFGPSEQFEFAGGASYQIELKNNIDLVIKPGDAVVSEASLAYILAAQQRVGFQYRNITSLNGNHRSNQFVLYGAIDF